MSAETVAEGINFVGKDFSILVTNELVDLVLMTMTSIV